MTEILSTLSSQETPAPGKRRLSIFLVLALASFLIAMNTGPRLLWIPVTAGIACAALAVFRREHGWGFSFLIATLTLAFFLTADHGDATAGLLAPETVKVTSWSWKRLPGPAGESQIVWNAQVQNTSAEYVEAVRLSMTTFDSAGKVVLGDFGYASAIPPGETRQLSHVSDSLGTEAKAVVRIAELTGHSW